MRHLARYVEVQAYYLASQPGPLTGAPVFSLCLFCESCLRRGRGATQMSVACDRSRTCRKKVFLRVRETHIQTETYRERERETHTHTDIDRHTHARRPTHWLNTLDLTLHTEHSTRNSHSNFTRGEKCFRATRRLVYFVIAFLLLF